MLFYLFIYLINSTDNFEVDGFTYKILTPGVNNVEIINCSISSESTLIIPATVSNESIEYTIISIESDAFSSIDRNQFQILYLPHTLIGIGNGAFMWFSNLRTIGYINENDEMINDTFPPKLKRLNEKNFWHCEKITTLDLNNVVILDSCCLQYCFQLENLKLRKVEVIGEFSLFSTNITTLELPSTLKEIRTNAFVQTQIVNLTGDVPNLEVIDSSFIGCIELLNIPKLTGIVELKNFAFAGCCNLTEVHCGPKLASIGFSCFNGCSSLTSFTTESKCYNISTRAFCVCSSLPTFNFDGVVEILENAFEACYSFDVIDMSNSLVEEVLPIFQDCGNISSVIFPKNLVKFDLNCFELSDVHSFTFSGTKGTLDLRATFYKSQFNITEIIFAPSCNVLLDSTFASCYHLSRVVLPKTPYELHYTFANCYNLSQVENLEFCTLLDYTFFSCISLTRLDSFPPVKTIGEQTFMDCKYLESIPSLSSIEFFETRCFYNCFNLKTVECGNNLKSIGLNAFYECVLLEKFTTLSSNYSIGIESFQYCFALKSFDFSNCCEIQYGAFDHCTSLSEIDLSKYKYASLGLNTFADCSSLCNVTFQPNLEFIDEKCFYNCANITSLHFPPLKYIYSRAFELCTGLENVVFENQPLFISYHSFYSCISLNSIELKNADSNSIASIEDGAFENCTSLKSFQFDKWSIGSIGEYAFHGCPLSHKIKFKGSVPTNFTISGHAFSSSKIQSIDLRFNFLSLNLNDQSFIDCKNIKCVMINENHKDDISDFFNKKFINGHHCSNYFKTHITVLVVIILSVLVVIIIITIIVVCVVRKKFRKEKNLIQPLITTQQPIYTIDNNSNNYNMIIEEEEEVQED